MKRILEHEIDDTFEYFIEYDGATRCKHIANIYYNVNEKNNINSTFETWETKDKDGHVIHSKTVEKKNNDLNKSDYWFQEIWENFDDKGRKVYRKHIGTDIKPFEAWWEYDRLGNVTHYKNTAGNEFWQEFNDRGQELYYRGYGKERITKYDEQNHTIYFCKKTIRHGEIAEMEESKYNREIDLIETYRIKNGKEEWEEIRQERGTLSGYATYKKYSLDGEWERVK